MSKQFQSVALVTGDYEVKLVNDEEPIIVRVIGADILRWEQVNQGSFYAGEVSLSRMAWVVWAALRRQRKTDLEVSAFLAQVEDLAVEREMAEDDEAEDDDSAWLPDPTEADTTA